MNLQYAKNPIWANAEKTMIDVVIKWEQINEELPFTASPDDCEKHGREIFACALDGQYGIIGEYVPRPTSANGQIPTTEV